MCDLNIYGFEILLNYCFGNPGNPAESPYLACPLIKWIGPFMDTIQSDLFEFQTTNEKDEAKFDFI